MLKFFLTAAFCLLIPLASFAQDPVEVRDWYRQEISVPYRLFDTTNINTLLALETSSGRVYQIHPGIGENAIKGIIAINSVDLSPESASISDNRFTLYPTKNIFTFILVDQQNGRFWSVQWNYENEKRFINQLHFVTP